MAQFQLEEDELTSDLHLTPTTVLRKRWPIDQNAPAVDRQRVPADVIELAPGVETDASDGEKSFSSTDSKSGSTN